MRKLFAAIFCMFSICLIGCHNNCENGICITKDSICCCTDGCDCGSDCNCQNGDCCEHCICD